MKRKIKDSVNNCHINLHIDKIIIRVINATKGSCLFGCLKSINQFQYPLIFSLRLFFIIVLFSVEERELQHIF
jgi:hypothetical protein